MRVLKNFSRVNINTIFRGRKIVLPGKKALTLLNYDTDEEDRALYAYLTQIYGFVLDITDRIIKVKN